MRTYITAILLGLGSLCAVVPAEASWLSEAARNTNVLVNVGPGYPAYYPVPAYGPPIVAPGYIAPTYIAPTYIAPTYIAPGIYPAYGRPYGHYHHHHH